MFSLWKSFRIGDVKVWNMLQVYLNLISVEVKELCVPKHNQSCWFFEALVLYEIQVPSLTCLALYFSYEFSSSFIGSALVEFIKLDSFGYPFLSTDKKVTLFAGALVSAYCFLLIGDRILGVFWLNLVS